MHSHINDNELLKRFWAIESNINSTKRIFTPEEQHCEEYCCRTIQRDITGTYIVKLPFRQMEPYTKIGYTRDIALKRFLNLERRFKGDPQFKEKYSEVIQEYLDLGHMEIVSTENDNKQSEAVYLPHHAVVREDKTTTKIRVVFDASLKGSNGASLNDMLLVGPTIQPELSTLIMKWRLYPIVLCADIIKMYRQIKVAPEDTHFQRLLWRSDPSSEMKEYQFSRVTFGTAAAPYLAVRTLQQLADDEDQEFPLVAEKLKNEFYVDDFMSGCQTVEEGIRIYRDMEALMESGAFKLQKWITNNKELAQAITEEIEDERIEIKLDKMVKILGLTWDRESDSFKYSITIPIQPGTLTKRKVISEISKLFDPLGWAAPCVVLAKVMIQKLWLAGIGWNDELPIDLSKEWQAYQKELLNLPEFVIPRWVETTTDTSMELHGFCNASNVAYAAVVYLRVIRSDGTIKVYIMTAKTKVAPVNQLSIPRLELMGANLLAKLITEVAETLAITKDHVHCWTDSTVVLAWLNKHPSSWTTFVGNRVSDILNCLDNTQWGYVKSAENPADVASRGLAASELAKASLWKHGPTWLAKEPINYNKPCSIATELEKRATKMSVKAHATINENDSLWIKYSSLQRLIRVVAYCKRFLKLKQPKEAYLTGDELKDALETCIKRVQQLEYKDDINTLTKTGSVGKKSKLRPLCPFIDEQGILRVGGRIEKSYMPLTPGHFLIGEPMILVPERNYEQGKMSTLKRWQLLQRMTQDFWRRWSQEFLAYMIQRYKWSQREPEPNIGDIVLVKEDNLPPSRWLLGMILEKHLGSDGITRVVTLKCNDSLIKRPTNKLCILPITT